MARPMKHYVYELQQDGITHYVGKGSGRRLAVQERRFGMSGRIVKNFDSAAQAYKFEKSHIAAVNPVLNKCAGGNGGRNKRVSRTPKDWLRIVEVGTRVYAARLLLEFEHLMSKDAALNVRRFLYAS